VLRHVLGYQQVRKEDAHTVRAALVRRTTNWKQLDW
jgi:hypothetical protein